jgi:zinc protease
MEDLDAATLDDVREWFHAYYGAANAVIVVAGDVEPQDVKNRVERYFGDIPAGPPLTKPVVNISKRSESTRYDMYDRVPQARIYKVWNVPAFGDADVELLDILADVLSRGKSSRLYKRLVYDDQIATDVMAGNFTSQLAGGFLIMATAKPGGDLAAVERAIDEELQRVIDRGTSKDELERSKTGRRALFVRGMERVGGFGGKSDILAASEVYFGSPDGHETSQARVLSATARDVQAAARRWLSNGDFTLEVHPYPEYATSPGTVDRSSGVPEVTEFPAASFPEREHFTLGNGLKVILAPRSGVPVVEMNLMFDAGYSADQFGLPGTASLALNMLDEGTATRTALQISDELDRIGATLSTGSNLDASFISMSALKENMDKSLELYTDVILNPSFPDAEFERLRQQQLAAIQREKVTPVPMALRVFPKLIYGEGHAYSLPLTGSGTEDSVSRLNIEALRNFHATWIRPNNGTLIIVGDTSREEIEGRLEKLFAHWTRAEVPKKNLQTVEHKPVSEVYIVDRPGSEQSIIISGHIAPPKSDEQDLVLDAANQILGGAFSSRINLNLREDKHWSYGAQSLIFDTAAQRPFIVYAPVQTDKTRESIAEVQKELTGIRGGGDKPPTAEELAKVKDQMTLTLPGRWETNAAVMGDIVEMVRFSYPENYWEEYESKVRSITLDDVSAQANQSLRPENMVWVIVGDRAKIEAGIRDLKLGEVHYLDADGNHVTGQIR